MRNRSNALREAGVISDLMSDRLFGLALGTLFAVILVLNAIAY